MTGEISSVEPFVWTCFWQSIALVVVGLATSFLLRRRSSRAHQILLLSIVAAVTVPIVSVLVKHYELGVFVAEPIPVQLPVEVQPVVNDYSPSGPVARDFGYEPGPIEGDLAPVKTGPQSAPLLWARIALCGWIAASLILAVRLLVTFGLGIRLLGRAQPLDCAKMEEAANSARAKLGIDREVEVCSSQGVRSPVIWCWKRRPVLLVPGAAGRYDSTIDWAGVLCHELAHWKRRDHISGLLAEIAVCILPWHVLLWWAKSRLTSLSEQACDDWVLATGQPGTDYAESLLDLTPGGQMAFIPAVVSSKKGLGGRVRRILKDSCGNPRTGAAWALAAIAITVCVALGVAFAQTRPARPDVASAETEPDESAVEGVNKDTLVQRSYRLRSCSPAKMSRIIKPMLSDFGHQSADEETGMLLIIDTAENLKRIEQIMAHIDVPKAERHITDTFTVYFGDPSDIVQKMVRALTGVRDERVASEAPTSTSVVVGPSGQPVSLTPDVTGKRIIATASGEDMKQIADLIEKLDKNEKIEREYEVVQLRYADAGEMADRLNEALEQIRGTELQQGVLIQPLTRTGQFIVFGRKDLREKVKKLIAEFDQPAKKQIHTKIFTIRYRDPEELVRLLRRPPGRNPPSGQSRVPVVLIAEPRYKWIIAKGSPEDLKWIGERIAELDVPLDLEQIKPRILTLRNSDPVRMAELLTTLFAGEGEGRVNIYEVLFGDDAGEERKAVGPLSRQLTFEAVPETKKIIVISNFPEAYEVVEKLIHELDKQKMAAKDVKQVREWIEQRGHEPGRTALPAGWNLDYDDGRLAGGAGHWLGNMAKDLASLKIMLKPYDPLKASLKGEKYEFDILSMANEKMGYIRIEPESDPGRRLPNYQVLKPGKYLLKYERGYGTPGDNFRIGCGAYPVVLDKPGMYELRFTPKVGNAEITGSLGGCYAINFERVGNAPRVRGYAYQNAKEQYLLDGLPAGKYLLSAVGQQPSGNVLVDRAEVTVAAGEKVTVDMARPAKGSCSLSGSILGRTRKGTWYVLIREPGSGQMKESYTAYEARTMDSLYVLRGRSITQETENRARYRIEDIDPGSYTVTVIQHPPLMGVLRQQSKPLTIRDGEDVVLDFDLQTIPEHNYGPAAKASGEESPKLIKVTGLVKNPQGRPVSGTSVTLFQTKLEYVTDAEGKFTAFLPSSDKMRYFFAVDKQRKLVASGRLAGGKLNVEINLIPARIVSGQVVDPKGRPVSGAQVTPLPMTCFHVLTDNEGRFDVGWSPEWHAPDQELCLMARHTELNLARVVDIAPEAQTMDFKLEPALALHGTIEDSNGWPILGAVVGLSLIRGWGAGTPVRDAVTNYQGRFELPALPQRQEYGIGANAEGYQRNAIKTGVINNITDREEIGPIILSAAPRQREDKAELGRLLINVVDEDGKPVDIASVLIWHQTDDGGSRGKRFPAVATDKQGFHEIRNVPVGKHHAISVDKEGFVRFKEFDIEVRDDSSELIVCVLSKGGIIEGFVTDEQNNPLAGVRVVIIFSGLDTKNLTTDENGHFLATQVPDGRHSVYVHPPADSPYEIQRTKVLCGTKDVRIAFKRREGANNVMSAINPRFEPRPARQRIISFPESGSVGKLFARDAGADRWDSWYEGWQELGEAKGDVSVAAGKEVKLEISEQAAGDLSALDKLRADDLQMLSFGWKAVKVGPLEPIGNLKGLKALNIQRAKFDSEDFKHLTGLTRLEVLRCGDHRLTDGSMRYVGQLTSLRSLALWGTGISDDGLKHLQGLTNLTFLALNRCEITDQGLGYLRNMTALEGLQIYQTKITDNGLQKLRGLRRLKHIKLGYNGITDAGLKHIENLTSLENIWLDSNPITDGGLSHLAGMKNLKQLYIPRTKVTDAGLAHLRGMKDFNHLLINGIGDEGIRHLSELPALETLQIHDAQITQASIPDFRPMSSLSRLLLSGDRVNDDLLDALRAALPNCKIFDPQRSRDYPMPEWRQRFEAVYRLEDDQVLKRISPPFIPQRRDYYLNEERFQARHISRSPDSFTFEWTGKLKKWGMGFGRGSRPLGRVLANDLIVSRDRFEGPEELMQIQVPGDWIVREGVAVGEKLKALEKILADELGRNIRFVKRKVERQAIIATGRFKFRPLPTAKDNKWVHVFVGDFDPDAGGSGGTAGSVSDFLGAFGDDLDIAMINQTESSGKIQVPYRNHLDRLSSSLGRMEDQTEKAKMLAEVLNNVSRQTNLQFQVTRRPVEVWHVSEADDAR